MSIEIVWLPVGGMITRIACGSTILRIASSRVMPIASAACTWPAGTDTMPARTISAMYAASLSARPRNAAIVGVISWLASSAVASGPPNGIPIGMLG